MAKQHSTLAAGALVSRRAANGEDELLVIHRERYDDWTLPKGKRHKREALPATAVREVAEETGVRIRLGLPLDDRHYLTERGPKVVSYWAGTVLEISDREPDEEVDAVDWVRFADAFDRLTYSGDRAAFAQLREQPRPTTALLVVRHAQAKDRKDWSEADPLRPLTTRGQAQATQLVPVLAAYGVEELVASTSTRCIETLSPFAEIIDRPVEQLAILSEERGVTDPAGVAAAIDGLRARAARTGRPIAVCGHRPVLPHILSALELADRPFALAELIVVHLTSAGRTQALESHPPIG